MRYPFGKWRPDLPPLKSQGGLTRCENVLPVAGGYGPMPSLAEIDSSVLPSEPRGVVRGQLTDGSNFFVAGTSASLYRKGESGWVDSSRAGGYTDISKRRWAVVQFGTSVFASNFSNEMQAMDLARDTRFADVAGAPRASHLTVAENFLWAGDLFSRNLGVARGAIAWSALGNGYNWPDTNSDIATQVLSGEQLLEGNGGTVNAIISGSEVVAIFQENAIWRADFVGNDVVWQLTRVVTDHGLSVKGAAVAIERGVLFIAGDGFRLFDYTSSKNIGKDVVNDFFFDDYDADYPDRVSMLRDPAATRVYISYPGAGHVGGVPNRILVWDFMLDQWSVIHPGSHFDLLSTGIVPASIDSADTPADPDRIGGTAADTDPPGDQSFDDRQLGAARVSAGAFNSAFKLSSFSGPALSGVLETGDAELSPGRRSLLTSVRPQVDGEETSVSIASLSRRGADTSGVEFGAPRPMDDSGKSNFRVDARYHRFRFNLDPSFTEATEFDVEFRPTGTR